MTPGIILTTVSDRATAERMAQALVTEQLAACINLLPITSIYRWQGELCNEPEIQLVIKTDLEQFEPVQARIRELHPYDLPEIVALPIARGSTAYLNWMSAQLQKP